MPTIFTERGRRFFFFSNEGSPREPVHVHVKKGSSLGKFWLDPAISLAEAYGFNSKELREIETAVRDNQESIRRAWHEFFGD